MKVMSGRARSGLCGDDIRIIFLFYEELRDAVWPLFEDGM